MPSYIYIRIWVLFKSLSVRECKCSSVCFCCTLFVFVFLSFFKDFPSSVSLVSLPLLHFKPAPFISLLSLSATLSLFFLRVFPALFVSLVLFRLVSCFFFFSCFLSPASFIFLSPAPQLTYWFHFHTVGSCSLLHKPSALPPFKPALIIVQPITTNLHWASLSALALPLLLSPLSCILCFVGCIFQSSYSVLWGSVHLVIWVVKFCSPRLIFLNIMRNKTKQQAFLPSEVRTLGQVVWRNTCFSSTSTCLAKLDSILGVFRYLEPGTFF